MSGIARGPGARALEPDLLGFVESDQAEVRADLARAARPLRVIVPSGALRTHLASALVERTGGALLGVQVQTLASLAHEILARVGAPAGREDLFPLLVRRCARLEPALREALDELSDGYGAVRVGVDDLLDAGFAPEHAEALDEALEVQGVGRDAPERALVRVAAAVASALDGELGSHRSRLFFRARDALERDAAEALPARALAIYGFSDATGVQTDLLVALLRHLGARVWLELPPDPAAESAPPRELPFGAAFRERLRAAAREEIEIPGAAAPQLEVWHARDPFDEARAVAGALRAALDAGAVPERFAVVARDLAPYRLALRKSLTHLAVPFSGCAEPGPVSPAGRRLGALLDLLREGEALPAERWLEAVWRLPHPALASGSSLSLEQQADWRHALHAQGCASLGDAAGMELPQGSVRLRVPARLRAGESGRVRAERRVLGAAELGALRGCADTLRKRLGSWPASAPLGAHARALAALVRKELGWDARTPGWRELEACLAAAQRPPALERAEFLDWIARELDPDLRAPLGGHGAGVQVLSVMEARGLVFEQIFLLGLARGVFPRPIREDPLLPDRARQRLRDVLPDLPVKREGFDEERFLFAQCLAASARVVLCGSQWDAEGRALAPSPLLDALTRAPRSTPSRVAPAPALATPRERACEAGLQGPRDRFGQALEIALEASEAGKDAGVGGETLARARVAVLGELDPRDGRRRAAGPYLGFVGRARAGGVRTGPVSVTALEGLVRCGWQTFLRRLLDLAPAADARGALPQGADPRVLGIVVHAALEEIAASRERGAPLESLREAPAAPLGWPEPQALESILLRAAQRVAREEAIPLAGYAHALARRARAFVREAWRADWQAGAPLVLGVEVKGAFALADADGAVREISFRADRVDRDGAGLRLTDYKCGAPPARGSVDPARHALALRERIAQGIQLQASVYAGAAGDTGGGRYLYLAPDLPDAVRELAAPSGAEPRERLAAAVRTLLSAWDGGAFVPRLRDSQVDQEPQTCRRCEVKDACLRGDSGVRLRLGEWAAGEVAAPVERAAQALWRLPEASP